jgi:multimeric flavodoxin WrbA
MHVLALNSSPKMQNGNTELILAPFVEGMKAAGAEVELYYTENLDIRPCRGELTCMFRTPGRCIQEDDGNWLAGLARRADVLVFASPLYASGLTGTMKVVLDRLTALLVNPEFAVERGHTFHPGRPGEKLHRLVLVSSCAMWEVQKFDPVVAHMEALGRDCEIIDYVGALLRPHSEVFRRVGGLTPRGRGVLSAARRAGTELIESGCIGADTLALVSRPVVSQRFFSVVSNAYTRRKIRKAEQLQGQRGRD